MLLGREIRSKGESLPEAKKLYLFFPLISTFVCQFNSPVFASALLSQVAQGVISFISYVHQPGFSGCIGGEDSAKVQGLNGD